MFLVSDLSVCDYFYTTSGSRMKADVLNLGNEWRKESSFPELKQFTPNQVSWIKTALFGFYERGKEIETNESQPNFQPPDTNVQSKLNGAKYYLECAKIYLQTLNPTQKDRRTKGYFTFILQPSHVISIVSPMKIWRSYFLEHFKAKGSGGAHPALSSSQVSWWQKIPKQNATRKQSNPSHMTTNIPASGTIGKTRKRSRGWVASFAKALLALKPTTG